VGEQGTSRGCTRDGKWSDQLLPGNRLIRWSPWWRAAGFTRLETAWWRSRWPRVPPTNLFRLLPLLRREHRIQLASRAADDRVQLRLHLSSHRPELSTLVVHDRVDPRLLLRREANFPSESVSESAIPPKVTPWSVFESGVEHSRQKNETIQGDSREAAGQRHK
jgi:hypothetical protein